VKITFLGCLLVLSGGAFAADPLVDRELTLDETIRIASNNSQHILSAREDVNIALQRVHQAESLLFPKLDVNANWSKFRVQGDTPLMLPTNLGQTLIPNSPRDNFYTTRIDIFQPIYEGGRLRNTWRQARIAYEKARNLQESLQIEVTAQARQSFYDLLFAQARRDHIGGIMASSAHWKSDGRLSLSERLALMRENVSLRSLQQQAVLDESLARLDYLRSLNLELNTRVRLNGELKTERRDLDLQKLLAWSTRYRSELKQTEYQQESDALGISLSQAERTPRIGLGAAYERTGNDVEMRTTNWFGTLNVHLPVSVTDMIFGWAKVRERRAQYRQALVRRADVSDQIEKQVREAYLQYEHWQNELKPRRDEWDRVEGLLKESERTRLSALDTLTLARLQAQAVMAYEQAVHGHLWSLCAIERAVGHSLEGL